MLFPVHVGLEIASNFEHSVVKVLILLAPHPQAFACFEGTDRTLVAGINGEVCREKKWAPNGAHFVWFLRSGLFEFGNGFADGTFFKESLLVDQANQKEGIS
jgi:hypothetical protein